MSLVSKLLPTTFTPDVTDLSEHQLVDDCRRGKRAAQYELYRRYNVAMYNTCLRMCGGREDAEDMLQSSFADVFAKLHLFRGDATIGAWIKRIVINNCLNLLKRRKMSHTLLQDEQAVDLPALPDEAPEIELDVQRIKRAVIGLSDGYRAVLSLYLFEGYDHAEIAQVLNISEQTSKSQYSRARKRLRERLTQTA